MSIFHSIETLISLKKNQKKSLFSKTALCVNFNGIQNEGFCVALLWSIHHIQTAVVATGEGQHHPAHDVHVIIVDQDLKGALLVLHLKSAKQEERDQQATE